MAEKICRHCNSSVLVGLQYCPGCLRPVGNGDTHAPEGDVAVASDANDPGLIQLQSTWPDFVSQFNFSSAPSFGEQSDSTVAVDRRHALPQMSVSESYTRLVCPKCHRPHRAPLNQSPTGRVMCGACLHQFPASMATEFRKGADLSCYNCGVITFCTNGLKIHQCPNCRTKLRRPRDPEAAKLIALAIGIGSLLVVGFGYSVATQTMPQFFVWLCVGSVLTFFGFIAMIALGF